MFRNKINVEIPQALPGGRQPGNPVGNFRRACLTLVVRYSSCTVSWLADELHFSQVLNTQSHSEEKNRNNPTQACTASGDVVFISSWNCQLLVGGQGVVREEQLRTDVVVASLRCSIVPLIPLLTGNQTMQHVRDEVQLLVHLCYLQKQRGELFSNSMPENCNKSSGIHVIIIRNTANSVRIPQFIKQIIGNLMQ